MDNPKKDVSQKPKEKPDPKEVRKGFIIMGVIILIIIGIIGTATGGSSSKDDSSATKENAENSATEPKTTTKTEAETSPIPFETVQQDDATLAKGTTKTIQEGKDGEKTTTYKVVYDADGTEVSRTEIKSETTTEPVNKIVANGTYVAPTQKSSSASTSTSNSQPTYTQNTGTVHPGSYCSSAGATGYTSNGAAMVCKTTATDSRLRWRAQ